MQHDDDDSDAARSARTDALISPGAAAPTAAAAATGYMTDDWNAQIFFFCFKVATGTLTQKRLCVNYPANARSPQKMVLLAIHNISPLVFRKVKREMQPL